MEGFAELVRSFPRDSCEFTWISDCHQPEGKLTGDHDVCPRSRYLSFLDHQRRVAAELTDVPTGRVIGHIDWNIESSNEGPLNWLWQRRLSLVNGVILQHHLCMTMAQIFDVIRSSRPRQ